MHKALGFLASKNKPSQQPLAAGDRSSNNLQRPLLQAPSTHDVFSYRYHHGVNFGSIFVLEQWLYGGLFTKSAKGNSELDAVSSQVSQFGIDGARQNFEKHWKSVITADDWKWLATTGCVTTIRLPIGYFTLGENYCRGTPFESVSQVYVNAWPLVKQLVATAASHGIGVLLDFHALPGGANGDAHSGTTSSKAELWGNKKNVQRAKECLEFIAYECSVVPELKETVVGLQVVNEAVWNASGMYDWYSDLLKEFHNYNSNLPLYISDAWDLSKALKYSNEMNAKAGQNPVVVDTHKYYCFSDDDKKKTPQQVIDSVGLSLGDVAGKAAAVVVGEYSCVMDGKTWDRVPKDQRDGLATQFGQKQSQVWQANSGGSFFWTYKMTWFPGGEWGFSQQTNNHALPPPKLATATPPQMKDLLTHAQKSQAGLKEQALGSHTNYWNGASPGEQMEHFRFSEGWDTGFADATSFFVYRLTHQDKGARQGGDKIGFLDLWVTRRMQEYVAHQVSHKPDCNQKYFWEWSHGIKEGILAFQNIVGF